MPKQDDPHSWFISGNTDCEKYGEIYVSEDVFQRTPRHTTRQMGRKTVPIWIADPLQYLVISVKVVAVEEASFSDTQNPKAVC